MTDTAGDKIVLGLDPGTNIMGYAVVSVKNKQIQLLRFGVMHLKKYATHELKLKKIFEATRSVIEEFLPDEVALEAPFYGKNIQSMLKLGRAQGVAMAAALSREIPVVEYAPKKVKQSVTGNGNATKEQVAAMLQIQFKFKEVPEFLDATDALGVAICHCYNLSGRLATKDGGNWKAFLNNNPHRVK